MEKLGAQADCNLMTVEFYRASFFNLCMDCDGVDNVTGIVEHGHLAVHEFLLHAVVKNHLKHRNSRKE